jgi:hypothetical protein
MPKLSTYTLARQDEQPAPVMSRATAWITSASTTHWIDQVIAERLADHKKSEKDGFCVEDENPRLPEHVLCAECAEGLSEKDMEEYLLPSIKAEYAAEAEQESEDIIETEHSLRAGAI